jgi:hypothetical protein
VEVPGAPAGPTPAPPSPRLTDDTRKAGRHDGRRKGSPEELALPSRSAGERATPSADDPFERRSTHKDPFERRAKPTAPSPEKKADAAASKPSKARPQRKIIEEL